MSFQGDRLEKQKTALLKQIQLADQLVQRVHVCSKAMTLMDEAKDDQSTLFMWFVETTSQNWDRTRMVMMPPFLEGLPQENHTEDDILFPDTQDPPDAEVEGFMRTLPDIPDYTASTEEESEVSACLAKFQSLAKGSIDLLSNNGYTSEQYYTNLWNLLHSISRSRSELEKGVLLYAVLCDNRTPYFEVKAGMRMSNEEYGRIVTEINDTTNKLKFVLNLANSQRTETASQILMILDELKDKKEKCVLLAQLINIFEWRNMPSPLFARPFNS